MHKLLIIVCASVALLAGCSGNGNLGSATASGTATAAPGRAPASARGGGSGSAPGTGTGKTTVSLGSGTGSSFQAGKIAISSTSLSAGGSTILQGSLGDETGTPY